MIDKFIRAYNEHTQEFNDMFKTDRPDSYSDILEKVCEFLSNHLDEYGNVPDPSRIHAIDDGNYQGTLVFVVACEGYQPSKYWVTTVYYGSCSGCDTLQSIRGWSDEPISEQEARDYVTLALHMLQRMKEV